MKLKNKILDKSDYLHPYLFWYFNWIHNDKNFFIKHIDKLSKPQGLFNEPHAVSNRLINLLFFYNDMVTENNDAFKKKLDAIIFRDYQFLLFNTEEHVGANHLLDNYLSLLFASCCMGQRSIAKYFDSLIIKRFCGYTLYPEKNACYIAILEAKVRRIMVVANNFDGLNRLHEILCSSLDLYSGFQFNDHYSWVNEYTSGKEFTYFPKKGIKVSYSNGYKLFVGIDLKSELGHNGHDHDSSCSIFLRNKKSRAIWSSGTLSYANNTKRVLCKSNRSYPVLRPNLKPMMHSIGAFRNMHQKLNSAEVFDGSKNFLKLTKSQNSLYLSLLISFKNENFISLSNCKDMKFTFYSEHDPFEENNHLIFSDLKIFPVKLEKKYKCNIHPSLFRKVAGYKITLRFLENEANFCFC